MDYFKVSNNMTVVKINFLILKYPNHFEFPGLKGYEIQNIQYLSELFCCFENVMFISIKLCSDCV